ncbi:FAD-binding oxidoreductase [Mesorhizobium sp. B283B1A]|nr:MULTISPECIES: FAD-dependent oxidoreductase [Mesorhizobium]MCA0045955.1 FAD-binding oxidoreductase [Mesorhizobium sp. B283B1A]UQS64692.1 FAD-binding oxidoreductase [Mesorhizobium opportunistum]
MAIPPYTAPSRNAYDIVIVGDAVVGSSTAYWLNQALGKDASILVVERDSSYEFSSTALSTSAIHQQYSNPINVKISQFGIEIIRRFQERMAPFYACAGARSRLQGTRISLLLLARRRASGARTGQLAAQPRCPHRVPRARRFKATVSVAERAWSWRRLVGRSR